MSTASFLASIKSGAIRGWHEHQILPSITGAQGILEGASGESALAKPPYNNQFGIKASPDWTGRTVVMQTKEWVNGQYITVNATFRAYDSIDDSVLDHAAFFTNTEWRKNNYRHVVGERDYKKAAWALQNAGYATDPQYANKLIQRIEANNLQAWDAEALSGTGSGAVKEMSGGSLNQSGRDYVKNLAVTVIGDSLGVGTEPHLKQIIANSKYFVRGSRQLKHATNYDLDAIRIARDNLNQFTSHVVVILGTNAGLSPSDVNEFVALMGNRMIYWVNTASRGVINQARRDNVTNEIRKASTANSNVYLLNWDDTVGSNWSNYYGSDSVHMTSAGYKAHAEFIANSIYRVLNSQQVEAPSTPSPEKPVVRDEQYIGIEGIEYDDGRYYSLLGESSIQDREANQRFSRQQSTSFGWITRPLNSDETDVKKLFAEALDAIKTYSEPKITYEVPINFLPDGVDIGDWVDIVDHYFNPPLYLQAQVYKIIESATNPSAEKVELHNFVQVDSGIDSELLAIQNQLTKVEDRVDNSYTISIESSHGNVLTSDNASTTLTATLLRYGKNANDTVDEFYWWRKSDPTTTMHDEEWVVENSPTVTITGNEFGKTASFHVIAKINGRIVGETMSTIRKVDTALWPDGDTPPDDALDGATWVDPDGKQWIKNNGKWEERVDKQIVQEVVDEVSGEIVGEVQKAVSAAEEAKQLAVSQANQAYEDAVAEADRLAGLRDDGITIEAGQIVAGTIDVARLNAVDIVTKGLSADVIKSTHIDADVALIDKLFATEALVDELTSKTAFIESIQAIEISADQITTGTLDATNVTIENLDVNHLMGDKSEFLQSLWQATNSQSSIDGNRIRIDNDAGDFIEMNNIPELRADDADGTALLLSKGRIHFYDKRGHSKGYMGTDMHTEDSNDFGTYLSKGSGNYTFARMADATQVNYLYYTVKAGLNWRVAVIEDMVRQGLLPDGNANQFVANSNMIALLNGWPTLPQDWPALTVGQQIRYREVAGEVTGEAYEKIWQFGPSSQGDWRIYFLKHARFEGGFTDTSDRRIKHNIDDSGIEALSHIDKLEFKEFVMNNDDRYEPIGLIAQEAGILRVADDDVEGINITRAIMLALKGVQELHNLIKEKE